MTASIDHGPGRFSQGHPHRTIAGEPVIFVVEDDWRTRDFICTVLKYSTNARVIESSGPHDVLMPAQETERRIDLLIANVDLACAITGVDLACEIVANNSSTRVLLLSGRELPPCDIPPAWRFLSIPFPTATFLNCIRQLCDSIDPALR
jgi:FixJ family two-component response regulator